MRAQIEKYDKTEPHFGFDLGLEDISGPNSGSLSIIHRSERIAMVMAGSAGSGKSSNDLCAALTAACLRRCARAYYALPLELPRRRLAALPALSPSPLFLSGRRRRFDRLYPSCSRDLQRVRLHQSQFFYHF